MSLNKSPEKPQSYTQSFLKLLASPYFYIFGATYYGLWMIWNFIFVPYYNPSQVIGVASKMHYNPNSNILRFILGIGLPPLLCFIYWFVTSRTTRKPGRLSRYKIALSVIAIVLSLGVSAGMAIVQSSTSGTNDKDVYGGPYKNTLVDSFHEGETLGTAVSYEQKDMKPYRNFVFVHGVFQDPVRSILAFKFFGHSIGAERAFSAILTIFTFVLLYIFLVVLFRGNVYKSSVAISVIGLMLLPVAGNTLPFLDKILIGIQLQLLDFSTLFFLLFAILGLRASQLGRFKLTNLYALLVGFSVFTAYANSIDRAFFVSGLAVIWLAMLLIMTPLKQFIRTTFISFIIGSLAGIVVLGIALKGDFADFLSFLLHISQYKEFMDGLSFDRPNFAIGLVLVTLSGLITLAGARVLTGVTAGTPSESWRTRVIRWRKQTALLLEAHATFILLLATAIIYLRSAIGRADYGHFAYSIIWAYIAVLYIVLNHVFAHGQAMRRAVTFLSIIVLSFTALYYGILVNRIDMPKNTFPIHVSDKDLTRPDYRQTADYIRQNTTGSQTFMTLTSEGFWYYLVDKPSPVKYPIVWFAGTLQQRQELAASLSGNKNIKFVITNNNWTSDIDNVPTRNRIPEVYNVLESQFVPKTGFGQQTVWQRK